jgi:malonyl CoA-acyl carrier protein transacylase/acyl carrier protein
MIGHSIGEYVAACLSTVFSLEDALALVAARGQLMQKMPGGAMLAVSLPENEVRRFLGRKLSLAALNGPSLCVVSGPKDAVDAFQNRLAQQGVSCSRLHTSHAFHSEMMAPILEPFTEQVKRVALRPPGIPFMSNVTGSWITAGEAQDPSYWAKHLRQTVRFAEGVRTLVQEADPILLEVGPGRALSSLVKQHPDKTSRHVALSSLRHPQDHSSDSAFLLNTVGRLWLAGKRVDWPGLYSKERRYRIPLPTYPFERQRYWVEPRRQAYGTEARPLTLDKRPDIADWFYVPSWKRSIPLQILKQEAFPDYELCWLVFTDECGVGPQIVQRLEQHGQDVISVRVEEKFNRVSEALYTINPQARDDYHALIKELRAQDRTPNRIVHLWSVTPGHHTPSGIEFLEESQNLGFYSLLFLSQALAAQRVTEPLQIDVISNQMHELFGETITYPEKATVLGPCRVIPQEYANITCRSIDISLDPPTNLAEEELVDQVVAEIIAKPSDLVIAYRGRHRWVQTFEPVRLENKHKCPARFKDRGVYLITGGLGGIGFVFAEHLAKTVKAQLILTGRTALPARDQWPRWLETHDDQDGISRKIRKVQSLEELGAEVLTIGADVADVEEMQHVIARATERFGQIHGVIHGAGVAVSGGIIPLKTVEMAADVLAPKINGTVVLHNVLRDVKPDFLLLCSSIASILPPPGQIDYCAANAFLDAFAQCHNSNNRPHVVSVNWDTWREVGMAVDIPVPLGLQKVREENLKKGILSKEGVDAFNRILSTPLPQVLVSTRDLRARVAQSVQAESLPDTEQLSKAISQEPASRHSRPNLSNTYVAPETEMQQTIAEVWQELLGIDQVGIYDNFFDLGGHSLLATQVIAQLEKKLALRINRTELMFQTLGQLATACEERMDQLQRSEPEGLIQKLSHAIRNAVSAPSR